MVMFHSYMCLPQSSVYSPMIRKRRSNTKTTHSLGLPMYVDMFFVPHPIADLLLFSILSIQSLSSLASQNPSEPPCFGLNTHQITYS